MAIAPPLTDADHAVDALVEALNGLAVGVVSLDFARRSLAAVLACDEGNAARPRSLIVTAWEEGRLGAEDYEALIGDLDHKLREDEPTEWSDDVVNEMAPTSDTVGRLAGDQPSALGPTGAGPLLPGAVLRERFVLQARVGASGMSEIYKALDLRRKEAGADNPSVAIKLAGAAMRRYEDAVRLLQQEAALAQRLDHPHIVRVLDFDRDGEHAFITMEWLDGESLGELLTRQRHRPLPDAQARQILAEIADALEFAHSRAVVHADVKPGNIFVTRDGPAKLLDFGIARAQDDDAAQTDARTPAYASCEVLEGKPATPQDDVFSLACVAYRMFAGHRAFGHEDALAAEAGGRRPARIRRLTETQRQALERALAFRREDRTRDVASFIAEFNAAAAAPQVAAKRAAPDAARPRMAWIALAVGVGLLAVALTLWRGPQEAPIETGFATVTPGDAAPAEVKAPPQPAPEPAAAPPERKKKVATPARTAKAKAKSPPARAAATPSPPTASEAPAARRAEPAVPATTGTAAPEEPTSVATTAPAPDPKPPEPAATATGAATPPAVETDTTPAVAAAPPPVTGPPAESAPPAALPEIGLGELSFRRYVEPKEPRRGRNARAVGWVELSFIVDAEGNTREVAVTSASPPGRFDDAALAAVKRWRFEPVRENGQPVARRSAVRLRFQPE